MDRGFITIPIAIIIVLGTVFLAGGSFGVYKYNEVVKEKEAVQQELIEHKEHDIAELEQATEEMNIDATSTESTTAINEGVDEDSKVQPQREIIKTVVEYVPVPATNSETKKVDPEIAVETALETLKVINVKSSVDEDKNSAHITWETTIDSDSRLILSDYEVFSSDNEDSKSHEVTITNLESSRKYNYEIVAEIGSISDSYFGKFQAPREFEVSFEDSDNEECTTVVVKDTDGYPLENTYLVLGGTYGTSLNIMGKTVKDYTNFKGEIEYCDTIERFWVENPETRDIYYDAR